jgi:hypothetical protein
LAIDHPGGISLIWAAALKKLILGVVHFKAPEDWRTPKRFAPFAVRQRTRQRLEPAALPAA